jgi:Tol biopolymer transport system component
MSSKLARRLLLSLAVAGVLPACGNINDGHPAVPFTILASVSSAGTLSNQESGFLAISGDGRFLVFASTADTLVPGDSNGAMDIFRRDLATGVTELVSAGTGGVPADNLSRRPSVSHDGRWIAFESQATNLTGVAPGPQQVYLRDMNAVPGTGTAMVSEVSPGVPGDGASQHPSISADGRFVAFSSRATNFGDAHANGVNNIYRRDMQGATLALVSISTTLGDPTPVGPAGSVTPSISADGSRVAYVSDCSDLVALDINDMNDVFVATIGAAIDTVMASAGIFGGGAFGENVAPSLSGDGRFVAFQSDATDLVDVDTNSFVTDIFVFDVEGGTIRLVSTNAIGFQTTGVEESFFPSMSFDGRYVAFESLGSNLVDKDTNQASDIFVKEIQTGAITRVSVDSAGNQGGPNQNSFAPSLSRNGRSVAFVSEASFVNGDLNGVKDAYVRTPLR